MRDEGCMADQLDLDLLRLLQAAAAVALALAAAVVVAATASSVIAATAGVVVAAA